MRPGSIVRRSLIAAVVPSHILTSPHGVTTVPAPVTNCPGTWAPPPVGSVCMCDPMLAPRDEAIALLHATAEIEHSLLAQYLYAAYSLGDVPPGDPRDAKVKLIRFLLLHIAREEMAHLATVQNLLRLLGGPLHFGRESSPFASQLLPFRFKLEPLSLGSLAKYVIAESPRPLPIDQSLSAADILKIQGEVTDNAKASNDGVCVGHVGDIYARLIELFHNPMLLQDGDFRPDTGEFQAQWQDWGFEPKSRAGMDGETFSAAKSLVDDFSGSDPVALRAAAIKALQEIADQGEGAGTPVNGIESHFEWFWLLYRKFEELSAMTGGAPVHPVPINPNTSVGAGASVPWHKMIDSGMEAHIEAGRITFARSRSWAQLFNLRYRKLLGQLHHYLRVDEVRYDSTGDRTARGYLLIGVFNEMRRLRKIAGKLVQMPQTIATDASRAGPPFELPYTTQIPDGEQERWSRHIDVLTASATLITSMQLDAQDQNDEFLLDLQTLDAEDRLMMTELSAGRPLPPQSQDFPKIVRTLQDAVRGFAVGPPHMSFWLDKARGSDATGATDGFVNATLLVSQTPQNPAGHILTRKADGTFDMTQSDLWKRVTGTGVSHQMPRERPAIPPTRIQYIEKWITANCPDSNPPYLGLAAERDPRPEPAAPVIIPASPKFNTDIRPLFRASDVSCMISIAGFDLSKYEDVKDNSNAILFQLDSGNMPPDGRWPQAEIDLFKAWIAAGFPEA
jgi:hypothetical protein